MKKHKPNKAVRVKIFNPAGYKTIDTHRLRMLVRHVLVSEKTILHDLHVIVVDDAYITRLNSEFFSRNRPTNVIAFDLDDVSEIYVSCDQARDDDDLYYYIAHGLMHLIGYTHDDPKQRRIMNDKCTTYLRDTGTYMSAKKPINTPGHDTK